MRFSGDGRRNGRNHGKASFEGAADTDCKRRRSHRRRWINSPGQSKDRILGLEIYGPFRPASRAGSSEAAAGKSLTNARNDAEDARQLLRDHRDPIDEKRATRDRARKADAEKKVEAERERTTLARVAREYHERVVERKSTPLQPASGFRVSSVTSRRRSGPSAFGFQALAANNGYYNTASGFAALVSNTTGAGNTATAMQGLYSNTSGVYNTATGIDTLYYNTLGYYNTASGAFALVSNTTGGNNIAVGYQAGYNLATGSNNIDIGNQGDRLRKARRSGSAH